MTPRHSPEKIAAVLLSALMLAGCDDDRAAKEWRQEEATRVLVKVCRDGSRVWRSKNGTYYIGGLGGGRVDNPETICQ